MGGGGDSLWGALSIGMAATRFAEGVYQEEAYGISGVPALPAKVNIDVDPDNLKLAENYSMSRYKTWLDAYGAWCHNGSTPVSCEACYADTPAACSAMFAPSGVGTRDDVLSAKFVPSNYQWPLTVRFTQLRTRAYTRCSPDDRRHPRHDLFVTFSYMGDTDRQGDEEFERAYEESGSLAIIMFWGFFACLCCMMCTCAGGLLTYVLHE